MKRKKIVAGNWKMNMNMKESNDFVSKLSKVSFDNVDVKLAPRVPFLIIFSINNLVFEYVNHKIILIYFLLTNSRSPQVYNHF